MRASAAAMLLCALGAIAAPARAGATDDVLPDEVEALLGAEPAPHVAVDPTRRYALLVHERKLLRLARLAEPAVELAGRRIELRTAAVHAPLDYFALTLVDLQSGRQTRLSLPDGIVGFPQWAPDGSRFAFTLSDADGTDLWIGNAVEAHASRLVRGIRLAHGSPCAWVADSRRLLCEVEAGAGRGAAPSADTLFDVVTQQSSLDLPVVLSAELARDLLEAQLVMLDSRTGAMRPIGAPAAFDAVTPAPSGLFVLVRRIAKPYPRVSGVDSTHRLTEVWDLKGNVVAEIPGAARAVQWHASRPAALVWVEERGGADRVELLASPYADAPSEVFALRHRFSGLTFVGDTGAALVGDYDGERQRTDLWHVDLSGSGDAARALMSYSSGSGQAPLMGENRYGVRTAVEHDGGILWRGSRRDGARSYRVLDRVSLEDGETEELWAERASGRERLIDVLSPDGRYVLVRRESSASPPNYFVVDQRDGSARAVTRHANPASSLADARRVPLRYRRADGLALGATLYLPPGYDGERLLPAVLWAYPRRMVAGGNVEPVETGEGFPSFERAFRLFFLLQGYAVLDDVSMPIVGTEETANDTFIEQIIANASAAIGAAGASGYVDPGRVGVAGHSYGAFMVANLLAHSRLFAAGAALSGAYNRTLTPFGFQTERRTLWEARDTYLAMSPLLYSHQIEAPLLLVHGLNDDNAGTSPLQSTELYTAIRGNGGNVDLLLLPWEGHSYRARESVLDTAARMLQWFDRNLKGPVAITAHESRPVAMPVDSTGPPPL